MTDTATVTTEEPEALLSLEEIRDAVTPKKLETNGYDGLEFSSVYLDYMDRLVQAQVPKNMDPEKVGPFYEKFISILTDTTPMVAQHTALQMLFDEEFAKPRTVPFRRTGRGETSEAVRELVEKHVGPYKTLFRATSDYEKMLSGLTSHLNNHIAGIRKAIRQEYLYNQQFVRDDEKLIRLSKAIVDIALARTKVYTPHREESRVQARMAEDAQMTRILYEEIAPISYALYWRIAQRINAHFDRKAQQASKVALMREARVKGQLGDDEEWDDEGNIVKIGGEEG